MSLSLGDEFEWELLNSEPSDMSAGFLLPCLLTNYETIRRNTSGEGMGVERQKRARTEDRRCAVRDWVAHSICRSLGEWFCSRWTSATQSIKREVRAPSWFAIKAK